jgi:hypothetical protein
MCWQPQINIPVELSLTPSWVTRTTLWCKSSFFWDITPCSPLKVNWCFGGTCHLYLHGQRKASSACYLVHAGFVLGLFFNPEAGGDMFLWNWLTFNRLHGVISQKIELFITTSVRTSNPTMWSHSLVMTNIYIWIIWFKLGRS